MKIVIIQGAFLPVPPIKGGAVEKIWYKLGQEFAEQGHEVIHISKKVEIFADIEFMNNVKHIRVKGYDSPKLLINLKLFDLFYSMRTIRYIPKDADVVITNTFWTPILLRGSLGKRVYVDVQRVPRWQMRLYTHVGRLRGCSPAICDSVKNILPSKYHSIVSYIPNPIPFQVKPINIKKSKTVLFTGRLHPEKGVHVLIEAFIMLSKKHEIGNWKLLIIGPHEYSEGGGGNNYFSILKLLSQNQNNIEFIGTVYNENELIEYYAKSSIFCYPAQRQSGDAAPVAPREAMAYGCVPVVSNLECFKDFIENGVNGLTYDNNVVSQAEELSIVLWKLINDDILIEDISKRAKLIIKEFSTEIIGEQFLEDFGKMQKI